jgi:hypothetical protein
LADPLVTYFALYRALEAGPVDDDEGVSAVCVGLFTDFEEAIVVARENLAEGYSISIDLGVMTQTEWDAIEEVPDDFHVRATGEPPAADASDPHVDSTGNPSTRV